MAIGWQLANEQWGTKSADPQTFPIEFTTACYAVSHIATSGDWTRIKELTKSNFKASVNNGYFIAIGK